MEFILRTWNSDFEGEFFRLCKKKAFEGRYDQMVGVQIGRAKSRYHTGIISLDSQKKKTKRNLGLWFLTSLCQFCFLVSVLVHELLVPRPHRKNDAAVVLQGGLSTVPLFPMGSPCVTKGIQQKHVNREAAESSFGVIRVQQLLIQCLLSVLVQGSVSIQSIFVMLTCIVKQCLILDKEPE